MRARGIALSVSWGKCDAQSLTDGERLCHQRVFAIWQFLRQTFKAFEKSILIDVASYLGVRETRRICGENTLTEEMVIGARSGK